jgi:protein-tyrosine-phosphatase
MAEAFARHYGMGFLHAFSAGISPSACISSRARKTMAERGIPLPAQAAPKSLSAFDLANFDLIVNLTEFGLPATAAPILKMRMPDVRGVGDDVLREIRNDIERRVLSVANQFRPKPAFLPILLYRGAERARL